LELKFLADVNIEKQIVEFLKNHGYDVIWIPEYDNRLTDDKLLELAKNEHRILITNDKDFGELVFLQRKVSSGIILLRIKDQSIEKKIKNLKKLFDFSQAKVENHFVVITENKIRFIQIGNDV
jgi:predicted nuclease of predicted toxin-antitoxin system